MGQKRFWCEMTILSGKNKSPFLRFMPFFKSLSKRIDDLERTRESLNIRNGELAAEVARAETRIEELVAQKTALALQLENLRLTPQFENLYECPREIASIDDCYFYHTMEIPAYGLQQGEWDLRGREAAYLGNVSLAGKRVLEIGTASGYLCFYMERAGAKVVAFDLSEKETWDIVPYAGYDYAATIAKRKAHIRRINNGFWFCHKIFNSNAKVVYRTVYDIPSAIGTFDICTLGCVLLHLRDPFLALQKALQNVTETAIVTDVQIDATEEERSLFAANKRLIKFLPDAASCSPWETWWHLSPELISEFLKILGFAHTTTTYHSQKYVRGEIGLYTVVGNR
jgi:SAM-dependent methyltransferase